MLPIKSLIAGLALSTGFAMNAFAVPVTINLAPTTAGYVSSFSYSSTEANFTVTGWSNKSNGDRTIAQDQIARWAGSGLGVENKNSPEHAVDNSSTKDYDALLFSFDQIVDVSRLGIGWYQKDADVSVLAYTGATPFTGSLSGNWTDLLANGWSVVGNYNRNGTGGFNVNPADASSQYWLVGAYNRAFGGTLSQNNDFFKLNSITFEAIEVVEVPESSPLILLLLGLAGIGFARRRTL